VVEKGSDREKGKHDARNTRKNAQNRGSEAPDLQGGGREKRTSNRGDQGTNWDGREYSKMGVPLGAG